MSEVQKLQTEPHGSDRRLRATLQRKLEIAIAAAWRECVEECARDHTTSLLLNVSDLQADPIFREVRWFYEFGGLQEYASDYLKRLAYQKAKLLYRRYCLHKRLDARRWKNWLAGLAYELYRKYAFGFDWDVAERTCKELFKRYGFEFDYYLSNEKACFVVENGEKLGDDWEVLRDDAASMHTDDFEYCRVVYAYSPSRRILVCLHHTYVPTPESGRALEWVLCEEWEEVNREEATEIALR